MVLFDHDWSSVLKDTSTLALYLAASTAVKLSVWWTACSPSMVPRRAVRVGHVTAIKLYPVKSMGGLGLSDAECTSTGLKMSGVELRDRQWLVTVGDDCRFVTARQKPQLLTTRLEIDLAGQQINISAPNMDTVLRLPVTIDVHSLQSTICQTKVWGQSICGYDCGVEAGKWLDKFLGENGHRLLFSPGVSAAEVRNLYRKSDLLVNPAKPTDKIVYHDDGPFLVINSASLDELNHRLDDVTSGGDVTTRHVMMENFRPTITIGATDNVHAFAEDQWDELFILSGSGAVVKLRQQMPCGRCMQTTIDPATGNINTDGEPLKTLRRYRMIQQASDAPCFGTYFVCDRTGSVRVGDAVFAVERSRR